MRPHVVIHSQVSVDGRIDWLPVDPGLYYELASRWNEDATLAGTDTLLAAEQFVEEPSEQGKSTTNRSGPLLVVPDSRGRLKHWEALLSAPYWRGGLALCTKATPKRHLEYLGDVGVESLMVGDDRVDLQAALECLSDRYGAKTVRVDSGGTLIGVLLRTGLVDEVSVLVSPYLVGGVTPKSLFQAPDLTDAAGVIGLRLTDVEEFRDGVVWLKYRVGSEGDRGSSLTSA
jgi:2,5-diamino-6-(ribosylamino)-4(3H)-pyrimidinone 5'-phosphate reductase